MSGFGDVPFPEDSPIYQPPIPSDQERYEDWAYRTGAPWLPHPSDLTDGTSDGQTVNTDSLPPMDRDPESKLEEELHFEKMFTRTFTAARDLYELRERIKNIAFGVHNEGQTWLTSISEAYDATDNSLKFTPEQIEQFKKARDEAINGYICCDKGQPNDPFPQKPNGTMLAFEERSLKRRRFRWLQRNCSDFDRNKKHGYINPGDTVAWGAYPYTSKATSRDHAVMLHDNRSGEYLRARNAGQNLTIDQVFRDNKVQWMYRRVNQYLTEALWPSGENIVRIDELTDHEYNRHTKAVAFLRAATERYSKHPEEVNILGARVVIRLAGVLMISENNLKPSPMPGENINNHEKFWTGHRALVWDQLGYSDQYRMLFDDLS